MNTYRATETIRADQLGAGDIVKKLPRDHVGFPLTAGRAAIEDVRHYPGGIEDPKSYVWIAYAYSSRKCDQRCYDAPLECRHMDGSAGGGAGRLEVDQAVERYTGGEG